MAAVEAGSYAIAAKRLFVNPSTISLAISNLEEELDRRLLIRSNAGVVPTAEGKLFYEHACQTVLSFTTLKELSMGSSLSVDESTLRIGVDSSLTPGVFPEKVFESFRFQFPQIHLRVMDVPSSICASFLKRGVLDAAVVIGYKEEPGYLSHRVANIAARVLIGEKNPTYLLDEVGIQNIHNMPVALPNDAGYLFQHINSLFFKHSTIPQFEILGSSKEETLRFFNNLNGVAFVLDRTNQPFCYPGLLLKNIIGEDRFTVPISFLRIPTSEPKGTNALLSHLRSFGKNRQASIK